MSARHRHSAKRPNQQRGNDTKPKWWKRPIPLLSAFGTALIAAIAATLGAGIGTGILTATKGNSAPTGPPIAIEQVSPIQPWQDYSFVMPGKLVLTSAQLAAMNRQLASSPSAYSAWFLSHGGVIANKGIIGITVRGNASGPVTITDMQIVKHCSRPLTGGTLFYSPTSGAGPFSTAQIGFDLGQQVSIGQYIPAPSAGANSPGPGGNFFAKQVITLKPDEPQTLSAYVTAEDEYCSFTFQLHIATPKGPVTETISNNGKPFQITSDGEYSSAEPNQAIRFSSYNVAYAGGVADQQNQGSFVQVNPASYAGTGSPVDFPPAVQSNISPTLGQPAGIFVHGSVGFGEVKPSEIFNGGDPTGLVTQIVWSSWGGAQAVGIGKSDYVGPNQEVASGTEEAATVVAFDLGNCDGKLMYKAVEWYFPQHGQSFDPHHYENICTGTYVPSS